MKRTFLALTTFLIFAIAAAPRLTAPDSWRSALLYTPFGLARSFLQGDESSFWIYRIQTCARTPPWESPLLGGFLLLHTVVVLFALAGWIKRPNA